MHRLAQPGRRSTPDPGGSVRGLELRGGGHYLGRHPPRRATGVEPVDDGCDDGVKLAERSRSEATSVTRRPSRSCFQATTPSIFPESRSS